MKKKSSRSVNPPVPPADFVLVTDPAAQLSENAMIFDSETSSWDYCGEQNQRGGSWYCEPNAKMKALLEQ